MSYSNVRITGMFVDPEASKIAVRGEATFTWTSASHSEDEVWTYNLEYTRRTESRWMRYGLILVPHIWQAKACSSSKPGESSHYGLLKAMQLLAE